jgi:predicted Fe-Mo cluster-binding NifX family protein
MSYKIAAASGDGKVINQHFGRCGRFLIVEADGEGFRLLETREVSPVCGEQGHSDAGMGASVEALSDCRAVLASRIGPGAAAALEARGIAAFEIGLPIGEAVEKLVQYLNRTGG